MKKHLVCLLAASMAVTPNVTVVQADSTSAIESADEEPEDEELIEDEPIEDETEEVIGDGIGSETETDGLEVTESLTEAETEETTEEETVVEETTEVTSLSEETTEDAKQVLIEDETEGTTEEVEDEVASETEEALPDDSEIIPVPDKTLTGSAVEVVDKDKEIEVDVDIPDTVATEAAVEISDTVVTSGAIELSDKDAEVTVYTKAATGGNIYIDSTGTVIGADSTVTDVRIPTAVKGILVTAIGNSAFRGNTNLKIITFSNGISKIGDYAFEGCTSLYNTSKIFLEATGDDIEIGAYAFANSGLHGVDFGYAEEISLGEGVFKGCKNLTNIHCISGIKPTVDFSVSCCEDCPNLGSVDGLNVFSDNDPTSSLTDYPQPTKIGSRAFANTGLTQIYLLDTVQEVASDAFTGCSNLKYIHTTHNSGASANTSYTGTNAKVYYIGEDADFDATDTNSYTTTGETIGHYDATTKTVTYTPTNTTNCGVRGPRYHTWSSYPYEAFILNTVERVEFDSGIKSIGSGLYARSQSLKEVSIPATVQGEYVSAFATCPKLEKIDVQPGAVLAVGSVVGSTGLKELTIPAADEKSIAKSAFTGGYWYYATSFYYLDGSNSICATVLKTLTSLETLNIGEGWKHLNYGGYLQTDQPITVNLPSTLKTISAEFFKGLNSKSITIPNGTTTIGDRAFQDSTIEEITIPESVISMGKDVFSGCTNLKTVRVVYGSVADKYAYPATVKKEYTTMKCGDNIVADLNRETGVLTLTGTGAMYDFSENSVPWSGLSDEVKEVVVSDGITSIGNRTFHNSINLTKVTLPDSLTDIGLGAFEDCTHLEYINLPDGITGIQQGVFKGCTSLTGISLPDTLKEIGASAFENTGLTDISMPNVRKIGGSAFKGTQLQGVTFSARLTTIGTSAFEGTQLVSIEIPEGTSSIGASAFANCSKLTEAVIPSSITAMGQGIFTNDTGLANVYLVQGSFSDTNYTYLLYTAKDTTTGKLVDYCATKIYTGNTKNWSLTDADGNKITATLNTTSGTLTIVGTGKMPDYASRATVPWYGSRAQIKTVVVGEGITHLGNFVFSGFTNLYNLTLPSTLESIGSNVFIQDFKLDEIDLSELTSLQTVGENSFLMCAGVTKVTLPNSLTEVGNSAFYGCTGITKVVIPSNVERLGDNAFGGCTSLESITMPQGIKYMGTLIFQNASNLKTVYLYRDTVADTYKEYPDGITKVYLNEQQNVWYIGTAGHETDVVASYDTNTQTLVIRGTGETKDFTADDKKFDGKAIKNLVVEDGITRLGNFILYKATNLQTVELPDSLVKIGQHAFDSCSNLTELSLPDSVIALGTYTFIGAGITSLKLSSGLTSIPENAFEGCDKLTTVEIPSSIKEIGASAFDGCSSLAVVTLPEGLTSIGKYAFADTKITDITIPKSVDSLGVYAFVNKSTKTVLPTLKTVTFNAGTEEQLILSNAFGTDNTTLKKLTVYLYRGSAVDTGRVTVTYPAFNNVQRVYLDTDSWDISDTSEDTKGSVIATLNRETGELHISGTGKMLSYIEAGKAPWNDSLSLIRSVIVDSGVTNVGAYMFAGATNLSTVELPTGLTSIGNSAFSGCTDLYTIKLPKGLIEIGDSAFSGCNFIEDVYIPDTVTKIGNNAYANCARLSYVRLSDNLETIGNSAFSGCVSLQQELVIPGTVKSVGVSAFNSCAKLTKLTVNGMTGNIGSSAFEGCTSLAEVTLDGLTGSLGESVFAGCTSLKEITVPNTVTTVGAKAFNGCSSLYKAVINATVVDGTDLFTGTVITDVSFNGVSIINAKGMLVPLNYYTYTDRFKRVYNTVTVTFGPEIKHIYTSTAEAGTQITTGEELLTYVNVSNTVGTKDYVIFKVYHFSTVNGITQINTKSIADSCLKSGSKYFTKQYADNLSWECGKDVPSSVVATLYDDGRLVVSGTGAMQDDYKPWSPYLSQIKSLEVQDGVTRVGSGLFSDATNLITMSIADSVTQIGSGAFSNTGLTEVELGSNIQLEYNVFNNCKELVKATVGQVMSTGSAPSFSGCSKLEEVTFLDTVYFIGTNTFSGCSLLKKLTLLYRGLDDKVCGMYTGVFTGVGALDIYGYSSARFYNYYINDVNTGKYFPKGSTYHLLDEEVTSYAWNCGTKGHETEVQATLDTNTGVLTVSGNGAMADYETNYNTAPWTQLIASVREKITSVVISDGVTHIGNAAFANGYKLLPNITSVTMADTVESIGKYAFMSQTNIESIHLSSSLNKIGDSAFSSCTTLASIDFPKGSNELTLGSSVLTNTPALTEFRFPAGLSVLNIKANTGLFDASAIASLYFNKELTSIPNLGTRTFNNLPAGATVYTYQGSITDNQSLYPTGVKIKYLDEILTWDCDETGSGLTATLDRTTGILTVGAKGTSGNMQLYADVTETPWYDYLDEIKEVVTADYCYSIGSNAFTGAINLSRVCLEYKTEEIGASAFEGCTGLTEVVLYDYANKIPTDDPIDINSSLYRIQDNAFKGCTGLTEITIPRFVEVFGTGAFSDCTGLQKVIFMQADIPKYAKLDNTVFSGCNALDIYGYATSYAYLQYKAGVFPNKSTFNLLDLRWEIGEDGHESDVVATLNPDTYELVITGTGNMTDFTNSDSFWKYDYRDSLSKVTIQSGVTSIGVSAFEDTSGLVEVSMPDTVTTIKEYAFDFSSLSSVQLSNNITEIGSYAFRHTANLDRLQLPTHLKKLTNTKVLDMCGVKTLIFGKEIDEISSEALGTLPNLTTVYVYKGTAADNLELFQNASEKKVTLVYLDPDSESSDSTQYLVFYVGKNNAEDIKASLNRETGVMTLTGTGEMQDFESSTSVSWYTYQDEIQRVVINNGITAIGRCAFVDATNLSDIDWGTTLEKIGEGAFENCPRLFSKTHTLNLPTGIKELGDCAFTDCNFWKVYLPATLEKMGFLGYQCSDVEHLDQIEVYIYSTSLIVGGSSIDQFDTGKNITKLHIYKGSTIDTLAMTNSHIKKVYLDDESKKDILSWQCGATATASLDLNTGVFSVSGTGDMYNYNSGKTPWNSYFGNIKTITIGNGISSIGKYCFGSSKLKVGTVYLSGVSIIGQNAFTGATINHIDLNGVEEIYTSAFEKCKGLTEITIPESVTVVQAKAFNSSSITKANINSEEVGENMFQSCKSLTEAILSSNVAFINKAAFKGCTNLTEITIPKTVEHMGSSIFEKNLQTVYVYRNSTAANYDGYKDNTKVVYLDNMTWNCGKQGNNIVAELDENTGTLIIKGTGEMSDYTSYTSQPWYGYIHANSKKVNKIEVQDGVTYLGDYAFANLGCTGVDLGNTVTSIGKSTFNSNQIANIVLPESLESIGESAFGANTLTSINIPSSVKKLGKWAFEECSSLAEVTLNEGLLELGSGVFDGCIFTEITIPKSVQKIESALCFGDSLTDIYVYFGTVADTMSLPKYNDKTVVKHYLDNPQWNCGEQGDNVVAVLDLDTKTLTVSGIGRMCDYSSWNKTPWDSLQDSIDKVVVTDGVTSVGAYAFSSLELTKVELAGTIEELGKYSLSDNYLTEIRLPQALKTIRASALSCNNFTSVIIPEGVTTLEEDNFESHCNLESVILPESLQYLGGYQFISCYKLKTITLPKGLETIEPSLLWDSSITDVYVYFNTVADKYDYYDGDHDTYATKHYLDNPHWECGNTTLGKASDVVATLDKDTGVLTVAAQGGSDTHAMQNYNSASETPWAISGCSGVIKAVEFTGRLSNIGKYSFAYCGGESGLEYVKFDPTGIDKIRISDYAFADSGVQDLQYNKNTRIKYIGSGAFRGCNIDNLTLSSQYIYEVGDYAFDASNIKSVTLVGALKFGESVFADCPQLTEATVYSTNIGDYMFSGCTGLSKVTIESQCTKINTGAFNGCTGLTEITIPSSVLSMATASDGEKTINDIFAGLTNHSCNVYLYKGTTADKYPYPYRYWKHYLDAETQWNIGKAAAVDDDPTDSVVATLDTSTGVLTIEGNGEMQPLYTPWGTGDVTEVVIKPGVTNVGDYVFADCGNITRVTLPDTITVIGSSAFENCTSLQTINIPTSVVQIANEAFLNCESLQYITLPNGNLNGIGQSAFSGCTSLVRANIPSSVKRIQGDPYTGLGYYIFDGCTSLVGVDIQCDTVSRSMFAGCSALKTVVLNDNCTKIDKYAFQNCTGLEAITIPKSVTTIETQAFRGCNPVTVYLYHNSTADGYAEYPTGSKKVYLDANSWQVGDNVYATYDIATQTLTISGTGATYDKIGERLESNADFKALFPKNNSTNKIKHILVQDGITSIGNYAFDSCNSHFSNTYNSYAIESIALPDTLETLGEYAFAGFDNDHCKVTTLDLSNTQLTSIRGSCFEGLSSLSTVKLPSTLTTIDNSAFACTGLTYIILPSGLTRIGENAFGSCANLVIVRRDNTGALGALTIEEEAFAHCTNLSLIELDRGVSTINSLAFSGCKEGMSVRVYQYTSSDKKVKTPAYDFCKDYIDSIGTDTVINFPKNTVIDVLDNRDTTTQIPNNLIGWLFDVDTYKANRADLLVSLGNDEALLFDNWLNCGISDGSVGSAIFNQDYYLQKYHTDIINWYNGLDSSTQQEIFGTAAPTSYGISDTSIKNNIWSADDRILAFNHFIRVGFERGYDGCGSFIRNSFLNNNPAYTLQKGTKLATTTVLLDFWKKYGKPNGLSAKGNYRAGMPDETPNVPLNSDFYMAMELGESGWNWFTSNGELGSIFDSPSKTHPVSDSYKEQYSNGEYIDYYFDPHYYVNHTTDDSISAYYRVCYIRDMYSYWLTNGLSAEPTGGNASPVIDIKYYVEHNPDIQAEYNSNTAYKTIYGSVYRYAYAHFITYGKDEGRATSENFNVRAYRSANTDLRKAFEGTAEGTTTDKIPWGSYFKHYVLYGQYEARVTK